jgi:hypothetical protein
MDLALWARLRRFKKIVPAILVEARVARHVRAARTLRWHIDTLLAVPGVRIRNIVR